MESEFGISRGDVEAAEAETARKLAADRAVELESPALRTYVSENPDASKLLLHRSVKDTRCIDSNLESGRYISRVGRASSFLSLPESTSLYCGTYGTSLYHGTYGTTVPQYQLCTSLLRKAVSRRACKLYRSSVRSEREEQPRNSGASSILSYKLPLMISSRAA